MRTEPKIGQYYYGRNRGFFGVWMYDSVSEDGQASTACHIQDFRTEEEARKFVWEKNGWGQPKKALYQKERNKTN